PSGGTRDSTPTFTFTTPDVGTTFQCKLDNGAFLPCTSPLTFGELGDGEHGITVNANIPDDTLRSAGRIFTVDTGDPDTKLHSGAAGATSSNAPSFAFSANEPSTFRCRLDGPAGAVGTFAACTSPRAFTDLADGVYSFYVAADDAVGNHDPT